MYIEPDAWSFMMPRLTEMGFDQGQIMQYRNQQALAEAQRRGIDLSSVPAADKSTVARIMIEGNDFGLEPIPEESYTKESMSKKQAGRVIGDLEDIYFGKSKEGDELLAYGRVGGVKEMFNAAREENPQLSSYMALRISVRPRLARAMGDVGNLSFAEQRAAVKSIPNALDTPEEAMRKFSNIRSILGLGERDYDFQTTEEGTKARKVQAQTTAAAPTTEEGPELPDWMRNLQVAGLRAGTLGPLGVGAHMAGPDWLKKALGTAQSTALGAGGFMLGGPPGAAAATGIEDIAEQQAGLIEGSRERYSPGQTALKTGGAFLLSRLLSGRGIGPKSIIRDISTRVGGKVTVPKSGLRKALSKAASKQAPGSRQLAKKGAKQILAEVPEQIPALETRRQLSRIYEGTPMQEASRRFLSQQVKQQAPLMRVLDPMYGATAKAGGLLKGGFRTAKELLPWYLVSRALGRGGYRGQ